MAWWGLRPTEPPTPAPSVVLTRPDLTLGAEVSVPVLGRVQGEGQLKRILPLWWGSMFRAALPGRPSHHSITVLSPHPMSVQGGPPLRLTLCPYSAHGLSHDKCPGVSVAENCEADSLGVHRISTQGFSQETLGHVGVTCSCYYGVGGWARGWPRPMSTTPRDPAACWGT